MGDGPCVGGGPPYDVYCGGRTCEAGGAVAAAVYMLPPG